MAFDGKQRLLRDAPVAAATAGVTPAERLSDYWRALRRRWWLILAVTALTTVTALALTLAETKQYDATAKILLERTEAIGLLEPAGGGGGGSGDSEREL